MTITAHKSIKSKSSDAEFHRLFDLKPGFRTVLDTADNLVLLAKLKLKDPARYATLLDTWRKAGVPRLTVLDSRVVSVISGAGKAAPAGRRYMESNTEDARPGDSFDFVEGVLLEGQISTIVGPSFTGKTYFAVDLAMHVLTGRSWHGREVHKGGVIYIALEGAAGVHRRVAAWRAYHDFRDRPLPLVIMSGTLDLRENRHAIDEVVEQAKRLKEKRGHAPSWLVIDTLAHAIGGGSESADDHMNALYAGAELLQKQVREATGCDVHVTLVHQTGWKEKKRMRGSSVLFGNIYTEMVISQDERDASGVRTATITKQKDGEAGTEFRFRVVQVELKELDRRGNPIRSAVAVQSSLAAFDTLHEWQKHQATIESLISTGRWDKERWCASRRAKREYRLDVALAEALNISEKDAAAMLDVAETAGAIRRCITKGNSGNQYEAWFMSE